MRVCPAPWMEAVEEGELAGGVLRPVVVSQSTRPPRLYGFRDEGRSVPGSRHSFELPRPLRNEVRRSVRAEGSQLALEVSAPDPAGDILPGVSLASRAAGISAWIDDPHTQGIQTCTALRDRLITELQSADAPEALVVEIARRHRFHIESVCRNPRVQLRRRRELQLIDRVRQLDTAGLRWLARQPGRTIAERAGPRERILAIKRFQSADTLENRVLVDVIRRSVSLSSQYQRHYRRYSGSDRVRLVRDLQYAMNAVLREEWIGGVRALTGVPTPNYALLSDRRYAPLWALWQRMLRQEILFQSLEAWMPRLVSELVWIGCLAHFEAAVESRPAFGRFPELQYRPEFEGGNFLMGAQAFPPLQGQGKASSYRVDLVRSEQLVEIQRASKRGEPWSSVADLRPDFACVIRSKRGSDSALLVWAVALWSEADTRLLDVALAAMPEQIKRHCGPSGSNMHPCVVAFDASGSAGKLSAQSAVKVMMVREAPDMLVAAPTAIGGFIQESVRRG